MEYETFWMEPFKLLKYNMKVYYLDNFCQMPSQAYIL